MLELGQAVEVEVLQHVVVGDPQADDGRQVVKLRTGALERAGAGVRIVHLVAAIEVLGHDDLLLGQRLQDLGIEVLGICRHHQRDRGDEAEDNLCAHRDRSDADGARASSHPVGDFRASHAC